MQFTSRLGGRTREHSVSIQISCAFATATEKFHQMALLFDFGHRRQFPFEAQGKRHQG
jgi:hypothetical protein